MRNATYISPKIQNEIVATCGDIIVKDITNRITQSGFFSVLEDETTDVAGMEQLPPCIRYVDRFAPVKDKTGPGTTAAIIKGLQQAHLHLGNIRGRGECNERTSWWLCCPNFQGPSFGGLRSLCHALNLVFSDT
jgi:hypothetical protein